MKKTLFVLLFALYLVFGVFCQSGNSSNPTDLVVVLDTSSSMSSSYRETSNYLIGPFLKEFLHIGDSFHLISFSAAPKLEISRRIEGVGDVETIIARLLLMYPIYPESNISVALSFAESYVSSLPNRSRKVVLVSDGDAPGTQNLVNESSARFRRLGADLQYISVPVTGNGPVSVAAAPQSPAQSGQTAQATQPAQSGQTAQVSQPTQSGQTAQASQPAQSGQAAQQATQPAQSGQTAQASQPAQSGQAAQTPETTLPSEPAQQTQSTSPGGSSQASGQVTTQEGGASGSAQAQPSAQGTGQAQSAESSSGISGSSSGGNISLPLIIGMGLLLLLLLIGIFIFASRKLDKSPNRVLAKAAVPSPSETKAKPITAGSKPDQIRRPDQIRKPVQISSPVQTRKPVQTMEYPPARMKPLPKDKVYDENSSGNGGPMLLNLFVEDQNTAIGKRNIHLVKPGYSYTIGGGKSDFLIFLVPIPPRIADVSYDGRNCTFIPRKPDYLPDIGSQTIPNCIGKTFRVISDKKYELHIRLERYEDPLQALNKLFRSIRVPGPVL